MIEVIGAIFQTAADCVLILFWLVYLDYIIRVRGVGLGCSGKRIHRLTLVSGWLPIVRRELET